MNKKLGYQILELCGILLGNAILAFGIAAFVLPHGMITGGATGLGLVTSRAFGVDLSVAVAVYNIILFAVGAFVLGKKFALTTIVSTIVYPMFLSFFTQQRWIATMTNDILLSAIYAGIMVGLGVGIVIRFGASTGGLDIPPLILNKKLGIPVAVSMYFFDFTVLLLQVVISTKEQVLYGILIVILSSIVLGYVSLAGQKKVQVMIISRHYQEIRDMLFGVKENNTFIVYFYLRFSDIAVSRQMSFLLFFCAAHPVWTDCFWHLPAQKSYPRLESTFPG